MKIYRKLLQRYINMFQTPFALRNTMQQHECDNQSFSKAHFTRLTPIYNKLTLHYSGKREEKQGKERITPKFGGY
jgi:hypothetical protein